MPHFEPSFAIKQLQQVSPGALVLIDHTPAFAGVNRSAPTPLVTLAVHDGQASKFIYRYFDSVQPTVVVPAGEIIIKPKLDTFATSQNVQPSSDKLFVDGDETYIVVQLPQAPDIRLLSLNSGSLVSPRTTQIDAFTSWQIGVMSQGEFVPLLQV